MTLRSALRGRIGGWILSSVLILGSLGGLRSQWQWLALVPAAPVRPAAGSVLGAPAATPAGADPAPAGSVAPHDDLGRSERHQRANPAPAAPAGRQEAAPLPALDPLTRVSAGDVTLTTLYVPFEHQLYDTPEDFNGQCACGPASLAMVLAYYGRLAARPVARPAPFPHVSQYAWALTDSNYSYGSTSFGRTVRECEDGPDRFGGLYGALMLSSEETLTEWARLNDALTAHGLSVTNYDEEEIGYDVVTRAIDRGHPVILTVRGLTGWGHLIVALGYTDDGRLVINDSYGSLWDGYPNFAGANVLYSWADLGEVRYAWEVGGAGEGWLAQYYAPDGSAFVRYDRELRFDWGRQGPGAPLPAEGFMARWTRNVALEDGLWTFSAETTGELRLFVDGQFLFEGSAGGALQTFSGQVKLAGGPHQLQVEYRAEPGAPAQIAVNAAPLAVAP